MFDIIGGFTTEGTKTAEISANEQAVQTLWPQL